MRQTTAIPGDLRVVAGDIEGDSVMSWLKTLLADAFYWTDNDLVVQTRSMYGGTPRAAGATFLFDQGAKVSHFNYFHNDRTAEAIVDALVAADAAGVPGHRTVVVGRRIVRRRSRRGQAREETGERQARGVVLPGSNVKVDGKRTWHLATSTSKVRRPGPRRARLR